MRCVHCGWCCTNFAIPEINKAAGDRCQYLTENNLCELWDKPERPQICYDYDMPYSICPIGLEKRKQQDAEQCVAEKPIPLPRKRKIEEAEQ